MEKRKLGKTDMESRRSDLAAPKSVSKMRPLIQ